MLSRGRRVGSLCIRGIGDGEQGCQLAVLKPETVL